MLELQLSRFVHAGAIIVGYVTALSNPLATNNNSCRRCYKQQQQQHHQASIDPIWIKDDDTTIIQQNRNRRNVLKTLFTTTTISTTTAAATFGILSGSSFMAPLLATADDDTGFTAGVQELPVDVIINGDAKKLFNDGRAYEVQGNMAAAQRLYQKVTQLAPRFVYGYSNLGNTQTALGDIVAAEKSYTTAINLCNENLRTAVTNPTIRKCNDLYILLLNRGCIRLNTVGMTAMALQDLQQANTLRARPDAIVLQNLARAEELNGLYEQADRDYTIAISMTANEVNPFWLRSALVKYQLNDFRGGYDLFKRVEIRFPDAPEVRAASATFLYTVKNDPVAAQQKFLEIPDRQRIKYIDTTYLQQTIAWPPKVIETLNLITTAVGDTKNNRDSVSSS